MTPRAALQDACEHIPGLVRGVVVLVPDGIVVAHVGADRERDVEPLARAAMRCLEDRPALGRFVEYTLVSVESILVIEVGRTSSRLALAAECQHGTNLAMVMAATRNAVANFETHFDLAAWDQP